MRRAGKGLGQLGKRLLLAFVLVAVSSVLVLVAAALIGVDRGVHAAQQADREQLAAAAAAAAAGAYQQAGGWDGADLSRSLAIGDAASAHLNIVDADGNLRAGSGNPARGNAGQADSSGQGAVTADVVVDGTRVGAVRVSLGGNGGNGGTRILDVAWTWIAVAAVVALTMAVAASWFVTRRLVRPIRSMTEAARAFGAGNRNVRTAGDAPGELGDLAHALNDMADAVVRSDTERRNLTADVAHELRTPLAALQAGLEELRDGLMEPTPAGLAGLHDQSLRLGRVVADLAELSAVETAALSLDLAPVDLAALAADALSRSEPQLRAAGLATELESAGPVWVRADGDRLHQAVGNLLANSARYCRKGGRVTLKALADGGEAVLTVADTGPGIPAEELPHIFDRLWRGRAAEQIAGSGIGLALVREIVTSHGGTVQAASTPWEGTTISLHLPRLR
ncbi:HAMP domain-containing sensor histidine kinase [Arthrobacter sp. AL08]|uniref:sensor histidine kinase n=1 Tax=unclassified Arthrobacter TaxID=235627 RepID=UPI00249A1C7F|nr:MULTISPECIES: HAMP domain-containing sensor histidine kinase [unclassified Arthrobacter]MDI3240860.1 HAMP domain-containing sensor histidine kinase [Arthrobacter sp. AL05]MDI3277164.1 HAMP domain-containing sensor histidine kinase [Arthrobacter sp. AL08]